MKYYVYIFDKQNKIIAFALSCPDEKTGELACTMATRELGFNGNQPLYFRSGVISVDSVAWVATGDSQWTKEKRISNRREIPTYKDFATTDFELAESETKKFLSKGDYAVAYYSRVLMFMRSVDKALKDLTGDAESIGVLPTVDPPVAKLATQELLAADSLSQTEPVNHNRDNFAYKKSLDQVLGWETIAEIVNEKFPGEQMDATTAEKAAKRYQQKHGEEPIPRRKRGPKPGKKLS